MGIARDAVSGGVDIIQMREKNSSHEELIELSNGLCELCREEKVKFIVNDNPFIAKEVNADGVHLGQEDIKKYFIAEAREILGPDKIIGISTHSVQQFEHANKTDCDYIAFGPIFETGAKDYCIGTKDIAEILSIAEKPVVLIGGINLSNIDKLVKMIRTGLNKRSSGKKKPVPSVSIAAIRAIMQAEDVTRTAREMKERMDRFSGI